MIPTLSSSDHISKIPQILERIIARLMDVDAGRTSDLEPIRRDIHRLKKLNTGTDTHGLSHLYRQMEDHLMAISEERPDQDSENIHFLLNACDQVAYSLDSEDALLAMPVPQQEQCENEDGPSTSSEANRRRHHRFPSEVQDVTVLASLPVGVIDESLSGIAITLKEDLHLERGQELTLNYQGAPMVAIVRNSVRLDDGDWRVGMEWK